MEVKFESAFEKDLRRIDNQKILRRLKFVVDETKTAADISAVKNLKKPRGYETFYRIKMGDFRIGIEIIDAEFIFTRFLHRKEIYRYFP